MKNWTKKLAFALISFYIMNYSFFSLRNHPGFERYLIDKRNYEACLLESEFLCRECPCDSNLQGKCDGLLLAMNKSREESDDESEKELGNILYCNYVLESLDNIVIDRRPQ